MRMSKLVMQIHLVCTETKKRLLERLDNGEGSVKVEDFKNILTDSIATVAKNLNITDPTVYAAINRNLQFRHEEFSKMLLEFLTNQNNYLIQTVVENRRKSIDNPSTITNLFAKI